MVMYKVTCHPGGRLAAARAVADLRERQAKIKGLGGRFDNERRRWYVPAGLSLAPFQQYLRAPEPTYIVHAAGAARRAQGVGRRV